MAKTHTRILLGVKNLKNIRVCWIALIKRRIYIRVFVSGVVLFAKKHEKHKNNTSLTQFHIKQKHKERYENTYAFIRVLCFLVAIYSVHPQCFFFSWSVRFGFSCGASNPVPSLWYALMDDRDQG